MKFLKKLILWGLLLMGICVVFIIWSNFKVENSTKDKIFDEVAQVPEQKVGLVLGTGMMLENGYKNPYFFYRIDAAEKLFKSGKVEYLIVSGDNSQKNYNEPEDMQNELIKRGIPKDRIYLDFAGFRTLDSVVRAKEIFGQNSIVLVSQKFHNQRAIFLAKKNGISAFGYNAKDVNKTAGFMTNIREKLARAKVFWDLFFGVDPKFGGEKVMIR